MAETDLDMPNQGQPTEDELKEVAGGEQLAAPVAKKGEPKLHKYLQYMVDLKASDLHFKSNAKVHIRHKGDLKPLKQPPLSAQEVEDIWFEVMNEHQRRQLSE